MPIAEMPSKPISISFAWGTAPVTSAAPMMPATPPSAITSPARRIAGACAGVQAASARASEDARAKEDDATGRTMPFSVDQIGPKKLPRCGAGRLVIAQMSLPVSVYRIFRRGDGEAAPVRSIVIALVIAAALVATIGVLRVGRRHEVL